MIEPAGSSCEPLDSQNGKARMLVERAGLRRELSTRLVLAVDRHLGMAAERLRAVHEIDVVDHAVGAGKVQRGRIGAGWAVRVGVERPPLPVSEFSPHL